jgi:hypothetical protein
MTTTETHADWLLAQAVQAAAEADKAFMTKHPDLEAQATGRRDAFTEALAHARGVSVAEAGSEVLASLP